MEKKPKSTRNFKIPKTLILLGITFKVIQDKLDDNGSFDLLTNTITIGVRSINIDPDYTFSVIVHEISELSHALLCTRYDDKSVVGDYKFFLTHKEFSNHNMLLCSVIKQILINKK